MPITQWLCPSCKQAVPLDHFATTSCGAVVHPDYAAAVLADRDLQSERGGVRVSMGLGCVRKAAIMTAEDVAVDPLGMLTPLKGTAWHSLMEVACFKQTLAVLPDELAGAVEMPQGVGAEIDVAGELAGIRVTGKIDRVRYIDGKLVGEDHKTGKDSRAVYIRGGRFGKRVIEAQGAPTEYKVQLSLYAELYRQQFGHAWDAAAIWWAFSDAMWSEPVAIMSVEAALAHQPYDCGYSVEQLLHQANMVATGAVKWSDLPLVGKSIQFGTKSGCDYCAVRDTCWTESDGAPF